MYSIGEWLVVALIGFVFLVTVIAALFLGLMVAMALALRRWVPLSVAAFSGCLCLYFTQGLDGVAPPLKIITLPLVVAATSGGIFSRRADWNALTPELGSDYDNRWMKRLRDALTLCSAVIGAVIGMMTPAGSWIIERLNPNLEGAIVYLAGASIGFFGGVVVFSILWGMLSRPSKGTEQTRE